MPEFTILMFVSGIKIGLEVLVPLSMLPEVGLVSFHWLLYVLGIKIGLGVLVVGVSVFTVLMVVSGIK